MLIKYFVNIQSLNLLSKIKTPSTASVSDGVIINRHEYSIQDYLLFGSLFAKASCFIASLFFVFLEREALPFPTPVALFAIM